MVTEVEEISKLKRLFGLKKKKKGRSQKGIVKDVEDFLKELALYASNRPPNIKSDILDLVNTNFVTVEFYELFEESLLDEIESASKTDKIGDCLIDPTTVGRFLKKKDESSIEEKTADFISLYLGFAGWNGFIKGLSIRKCFLIKGTHEVFICDIDGIIPRKEKEHQGTRKKSKEQKKEKGKKRQTKFDKFNQYFEEEKFKKLPLEVVEKTKEFFSSNAEQFNDITKRNIDRYILRLEEDNYLEEWFQEIINAERIEADLGGKINLLIADVDSVLSDRKGIRNRDLWWHQAILASSLSLSVLKKWDIEKLKVLYALGLRNYKAVVTERSTIGVALTLLIALKNEEQYTQSLRFLSSKKLDAKIRQGIIQAIYFFVVEKHSYEVDGSKMIDSLLWSLFDGMHSDIINSYSIFEPIHRNHFSFLQKEISFEDDSDEIILFSGLEESILFNHDTRLNISRVEEESIHALEEQFKFERQYIKINESFGYYLESLKIYKKQFEEFIDKVSLFPSLEEYNSRIEALERSPNKSLLKKMFTCFPYELHSRQFDIFQAIQELEKQSDIHENVHLAMISIKAADVGVEANFYGEIVKFLKPYVEGNNLLETIFLYCLIKTAELEKSRYRLELLIEDYDHFNIHEDVNDKEILVNYAKIKLDEIQGDLKSYKQSTERYEVLVKLKNTPKESNYEAEFYEAFPDFEEGLKTSIGKNKVVQDCETVLKYKRSPFVLNKYAWYLSKMDRDTATFEKMISLLSESLQYKEQYEARELFFEGIWYMAFETYEEKWFYELEQQKDFIGVSGQFGEPVFDAMIYHYTKRTEQALDILNKVIENKEIDNQSFELKGYVYFLTAKCETSLTNKAMVHNKDDIDLSEVDPSILELYDKFSQAFGDHFTSEIEREMIKMAFFQKFE